MAWLDFSFLWSVPLLNKFHCLVDVVLSHVNLCSIGEEWWLLRSWWSNLLSPAWTDSPSCNNHPLDVRCSIRHQGRHLEDHSIHSIQWMKGKKRTLSQLKRAVRMRMMAGRVSQEAWPISPLPKEDSNSNSTWKITFYFLTFILSESVMCFLSNSWQLSWLEPMRGAWKSRSNFALIFSFFVGLSFF